jgi:chromosomal replication initiation ATPase DnaA
MTHEHQIPPLTGPKPGCPLGRRKVIPETIRAIAEQIITHVAHEHGVKSETLVWAGREAHQARVRQLAMYRVRTLTGLSYPMIGKLFGNRHHTTVMHACRKIIGGEK